MKTILLSILIVLAFVGEYSVGDMMVDPPLRYCGMGRNNTPIDLYDPSIDHDLFFPASAKGRFIFEFQGFIYEIVPILNTNIQVYRR